MLCQQGQDRRQYRLICPCVPLCRAGGVIAGAGDIRRICPDFGRRKKEVFGASICKGGLLTDAKMFAGESQPSNGLAFPQITRSAGIFGSQS